VFIRPEGSAEEVEKLGKRIKYQWGNMPAIDVLRLKGNEGEKYDKDLALLFAGE
jgi:hypothetical protein